MNWKYDINKFGLESVTRTSAGSRNMSKKHMRKENWRYLLKGLSDLIHVCFRVGYSGSAVRVAVFLVRSNARWRPIAILEKFEWSHLRKGSSSPLKYVLKFYTVGTHHVISRRGNGDSACVTRFWTEYVETRYR